MNPDQTLDPRFNLNNYRLPSQRRQSSSSARSPQAQQQMTSIAIPTTGSRPVPTAVPNPVSFYRTGDDLLLNKDLQPIINTAWNAPAAPLRRATESSQGIDQNLITLQQVFATIPAFTPVAPIPGTSASPSNNPTTGIFPDSFFTDISVFADWFRTIGIPGSAPPDPGATQTLPAPPPPAPATSESVQRTPISATAMPTSSAGPSNTIISKILEKMDCLAARQDSIVNFVKYALQTRAAESAELKAKNDRIDMQHIGIAENIMTATKAINALTERIDALASDVTAVRNVLGVPPHTSGPEMTDAAKYIRQERMKPADVQDPNTATGRSPNHAILVDEIDEPPVTGAEKIASRTQRSILDRLDSIEVDFAEFMERVRDPDADVDQLRGRSSLNTSGSRIRSMQDVATSPRTPSPALVAIDVMAQTSPKKYHYELLQAVPVLGVGHENCAQNMDDTITPSKDLSSTSSTPCRASDVRDKPSGAQLMPRNISPTMLDDDAVSPPQANMEEVDELFGSDIESSNSQSHFDSSPKGKGKQLASSVKVPSSVIETDSGSESAILLTEAKLTQSYPLHQRKPVFFDYRLSPSGSVQDNALLRWQRQKTLSRLYGSGDGTHIQHTTQASTSTTSQRSKSKSKTLETSGAEGAETTVWASELISGASSDYPQLKVGPPRKRKASKFSSASASKSPSTTSKARRTQSNTSPPSVGVDSPRSTKRLKRYVSSEDEDSVIYVQPRTSTPK